MKEWEVTVDGEDCGEEVGGVDEAGKEDKTEELLAGPLLESVETHVYLGPKKSQDRWCIRCRRIGEGVTVGGGQGWLG